MKKYKYIFLLLLAPFFMHSCHEEFLEPEVYSQMSPENFYQNKSDVQSAIVGVYASLQNPSYYYRGFSLSMISRTTNLLSGYWDSPIDDFSYENDNGPHTGFWNVAWDLNNRANTVLNRLKNASVEEEFKTRIEAEARFLRALNYFNLVRTFGHIPKILDETVGLDNLKVKQVSRDEIYQLIIDDLKFAESELPEGYSNANKGRATKWAAKTVLGKVYLTRAGYKLNYDNEQLEKGDSKYYQMAADKLNEVITSGSFELWENYMDAFKNENENGKESIFEVQFGKGLTGTTSWPPTQAEGAPYTPIFAPNGWGKTYKSWRTLYSPMEFYQGFSDQDERKQEAFIDSYISASGDTVKLGSYPLDQPHVLKLMSDIQDAQNPQFDQQHWRDWEDNFPVFRYANVLLLYSEALTGLEGATADARWGINQVRERAELDPVTTTNKDTLMKRILVERRHELFIEGKGWFDLVRFGELLNEEYANPGATIRNYLWPIPYQAIQVNPNLEQNPNY